MKNMRTCMVLVLMLLLFLSGCGATISSPEELIKKPELPADAESIMLAVKHWLPCDTSLTIPLNPEGCGSVHEVDLNGDGVDEIVAFYQENDYKSGFIVLQQDSEGSYSRIGQVEESGTALENVLYEDMTGDGYPEILLSWRCWDDLRKELRIYTINNSKPELIMDGIYTEMVSADMNGDKIPEIITLELNKPYSPEDQTSTARSYMYDGTKFELQDEVDMDAYVGGYEQILVGQVNNEQTGIFIDSVVGAHSGETELLLLEEGELVNASPEVEEISFKPYPLPSTDVNGDGIIEIGTMTYLIGYENACMVNTMWLQQWYQMDPVGELAHVIDTVWNYHGMLRFVIPERWGSNFTASRTNIEGEEALVLHYINDETPQVEGFEVIEPDSFVNAQPIILTIYSFTPEVWAGRERELEDAGTEYIKIGENAGRVIVAVQPGPEQIKRAIDKNTYSSMLLSEKEIMKSIIFIEND